MEGGHGGATRGRHWAGGLHSCRLLLLIGTAVNRRNRLKAGLIPECISFHDDLACLRLNLTG